MPNTATSPTAYLIYASTYTEAWHAAPSQRSGSQQRPIMVETRIKPYREQVAEETRRAEQRRVYKRNQTFGILMVAATILIWWLFHTNPKWIFPPGWWRP